MDIILGLIQFIIVGWICVYEANQKSPAVFLWATLMLMFSFPHLQSIIVQNNSFDMTVMNLASVFVILFCLIYMMTRILMGKRREATELGVTFDYYAIKATTKEDVTIMFVLLMIAVFFSVISEARFSGNILLTSWGSGRRHSASLGYANSNQLFRIILFSFGGISVYLWIIKRRILSIIALGGIFFLTIITRNRVFILPFLLFFISLFLFKMQTVKARYVIVAILAGILTIYIVYGLRTFRHYGTLSDFVKEFEIVDFWNRINLSIESGSGELGLRRAFYYFIQNNNQFEGFGTGATYLRMILVYLPSKLTFGIKPDDFAQTMGSAVGMGAGGSMHPTLFGDCYANLGWAGILLGMFWAAFCSISDRIIVRFNNISDKVCCYILVASCYVIIGRGSVYNSFFIMAWGIPLIWVVRYCLRRMSHIKIKLRSG